MLRRFTKRLLRIFEPAPPPFVSENSKLYEIAYHYPHLQEHLEKRYAVRLSKKELKLSLHQLVVQRKLPSAQIVFMELQLFSLTEKVRPLPAPAVAELLNNQPETPVLDVREHWEGQYGKIPRAVQLTGEKLDELLRLHPKEKPVVVYCHFGIRSMDAAIYLTEKGFKEVYTILGGIDAWSKEIDPTLPRYGGGWC